jgi:type II secretory pathway component PulL
MSVDFLRRKLGFAVIVLIGVSVVMAVQLHRMAEDTRAIRKEMEELYILHINHATQIDILLNLRLRELRPEEQEWLRKTKEEYSDE